MSAPEGEDRRPMLPPETAEQRQAREQLIRGAEALRDRAREDLEELTLRINASLAQAYATPLDPAVFTGAPPIPPGLPQVAHGTVVDDTGTRGGTTPTPTEGAAHPVVAQDENGSQTDHGPVETDSQPTPADLRRAWVDLHAHMVAGMETQLSTARSMLRYVPRSETGQRSFLATEWGALQLLKVLRDMKAPEVPVDDTLGQATLDEALDPSCPYPLDADGGCSHHRDDACQRQRDA